MDNQQNSLMIVSGAGAGLGQSLLRRFDAGGYNVVGLVQTMPKNNDGLDLRRINMTDAERASSLINDLIATYGAPKVVIHNTAQLVIQPFLQTTLDDLEGCWQSMVQSAFILAQSVVEPMIKNGGGVFVVSGATASLRGSARFSAFASAKFALRGLTQSLAREYQSQGIHVVHTILDGIIDSDRSRQLHNLNPSRMMKPEDIAEVYWQLVHMPQTTWTHEIDLRPSSETF